MKLDFIKMQAQGNDYIYFDLRLKLITIPDFSELARKLSSRHFGIGADGIVMIFPSQIADAKMVMYNADGSRGKMCGSALRSVIGYLGKESAKQLYKIETDAGIKTGEIYSNGENPLVEVNLGKPEFVEVNPITVQDFTGYYIDIGNPHFVILVEKLEPGLARKFGPGLENSPYFGEGINVEFVERSHSDRVIMQVWERGSGITLACGTGSAAVAFCGIEHFGLSDSVTVEMPGGEVVLTRKEGSMYLKGIVVESFRGSVEL